MTSRDASGRKTTVLFTGYAPVHFVCFQPIYERLVEHPDFEVFVAGGLRTKTEDAVLYDKEALYDPLGVPRERVLSMEQIREMDFDFLFGANTKLLCPRTVRNKVQIFHGVSFRNKSIREDNRIADYHFVVGPYMKRKFVEAGVLDADDPRTLEMGFLKTDRLVNGALDREELLRRNGFDGSRPVLLYAPTGQKHNSLETMGEETIRRLAASGRFDLLIKPHDHPKKAIDWFSRLAPLEDEHTRVSRDADVIPLLFLADLLITDASSVSNEYSLLNRPMVFLDVPRLLDKACQDSKAMFDGDTWARRCGVIVGNPHEVVDAVTESLEHPERDAKIRQAMAEDLFYNPGRSCDVAMQWLEKQTLEMEAAEPKESLNDEGPTLCKH